MSLIYEERLSESPYVETVTRGQTQSAGSTVRPAERHWHMVIVQHEGATKCIAVGPWTNAGVAAWGAGAEILWIKFRLGVFMPQLPTSALLDRELVLPDAMCRSFWLNSSAWQIPDYENADTFVNRLARAEILAVDPVVSAVLADRPQDLAPRTVRQRFLRATGLAHSHIRQIERAQRAAALLRQGRSIADTAYELGYFDQPHLTRSLRQWVGHTPAQIARLGPAG
jgi:Helix-turn-helix domain